MFCVIVGVGVGLIREQAEGVAHAINGLQVSDLEVGI